MIFGILSLSVNSMLGAGGSSVGYLMVIVDQSSQKFYVDISEQTYKDLAGIYALSTQRFQDVSMGVVQEPPVTKPAWDSPTGTPQEIELMRRMMAEGASSDSDQNIMKKLGFVSDDVMRTTIAVDPVEDVLTLASEYEEDYEDPGEESFSEEEVEEL